MCVEQLTLDFEYLINEVIRSDAAWAPQFCSFSDYDVVILEVNKYTHTHRVYFLTTLLQLVVHFFIFENLSVFQTTLSSAYSSAG